MLALVILGGLLVALLFIYVASRLAGLGWYTSMKEVIKNKGVNYDRSTK